MGSHLTNKWGLVENGSCNQLGNNIIWAGRHSSNRDGYKLLYNSKHPRDGVGIVVSPQLRDTTVKVARISNHLMSIKIHTVMQVVSCYAPKTNCFEADKDDVWDIIDSHLLSFGHDECVTTGGDLNGNIGQDWNYEHYHGGEGFGSCNKDWGPALACAEAHDLNTFVKTFFKKRPAHFITYSMTPKSDYWLTRGQHLNLVTNAICEHRSPTPATHHRLTAQPWPEGANVNNQWLEDQTLTVTWI